MAFGERLKEARLMRGYTQKQLAEKLGVAGTTVTGYEKNNSEPNMMIISKIMSTLDVDANFLFQDESESIDTLLDLLEYKLIEKYRALDMHGKKMVDFTLENEYQRSISNVVTLKSEYDYLQPVAVHECTDIEITDEMRKHDDDIMNDDNF